MSPVFWSASLAGAFTKTGGAKLAAGFDCHFRAGRRRLGGVHLVRLDLHDLADVWHCQSTTGSRGLVRRHDDPDQLRQGKICVGNHPAVVICQHNHPRRRVQIHNRHLLAASSKAGNFTARLINTSLTAIIMFAAVVIMSRLDPALAGHPKAPPKLHKFKNLSLKNLCNLWIIPVFVSVSRHYQDNRKELSPVELSLKLRRAAIILAATVTTLAFALPTYAQSHRR